MHLKHTESRCALLLLCALSIALPMLAASANGPAVPVSDPQPSQPKRITLAIRDDYEKGDDLGEIAKDFALCQELGVDELFVNIGWDDYEPERDKFDFVWLHQFVELAAQHGLKLRPYICYKPWWEGDGRWNSPPSSIQQWRDFCAALGREMKRHPNILSFEIWLEPNTRMWWRGTPDQYRSLFQHASEALRDANSSWQIALGGLTYPDSDWLRACTEDDFEKHYDVVPLHCYNETWAEASLEEYFTPEYTDWFLPILEQHGGSKPIWMSECGFSTLHRSEEAQANYLARAVPYFFSDSASHNQIALFTYYELKDLPEGSQMIGDEHNYHFGLCRSDGTKKLAFHTYGMLTDLLNGRLVTPADREITLEATAGRFGQAYHHLLKRSDGAQILFIYDRQNTVTARATLATPGDACLKRDLDGSSHTWADFDGTAVSNIPLSPGQVCIFEIN